MASIFICGDIVNYRNEDGLICSKELAEIIHNADYSIGNFEAPIEGVGTPVSKSGIHHYQRKATVVGLRQQGFNMLSLANNHVMDYGTSAMVATKEEAGKHHLDTIGVGGNFDQSYQPLIKTVKGIKLGFINACEAQFGVLDYFTDKEQAGYAWINHNEIDKQLLELNRTCDFVIVLAHAGLENYFIPQKEWRIRYKHFCDLGADLVVASHPHVPQGYEYYQDSIIFYSLGNFYFDSKNYRMKEDCTYSVLIELDKDNRITFEPVFHHKEGAFVQLSPKEKQIDLEQLNSCLSESVYNRLHDEMSIEAYYKIIQPHLLYSILPIGYEGNMTPEMETVFSELDTKANFNKNQHALHLIRNEAYYYAARHALELISRK